MDEESKMENIELNHFDKYDDNNERFDHKEEPIWTTSGMANFDVGYNLPFHDESLRNRRIDSRPGWGVYVGIDDANEWNTLMASIGISKNPKDLTRCDLVGRSFQSLEEAELFYGIYVKSVGFSVRNDHLRHDKKGVPRLRS